MASTLTKEKLFWEIHENLPRQGIGDLNSTAKAFRLIEPYLPQDSTILDIGCGSGAQTLDILQQLIPNRKARIVAVDIHEPFIAKLNEKLEFLGEKSMVKLSTFVGDMRSFTFPPESFELIWAEGSIYIMGFEKVYRAQLSNSAIILEVLCCN